MSAPLSKVSYAHRSRRPHLLWLGLAAIAATATAIALAVAINGSGIGPTKTRDASVVSPGTGVSLGRDPQVQLGLHKHMLTRPHRSEQ
jgi:hypothetical protein